MLANKNSRDRRQRLKQNNYTELQRRDRDQNLRALYGFGLAKYEQLVSSQGGKCRICGRPPARGRFQKLAVDHDHATGEFRGLLCSSCNLGLGLFEENTGWFLNAVRYLNLAMKLDFPLQLEIRASSSSGFTKEVVERRLAELTERQAAGEESVAEEIRYLQSLQKRKWGI